MDFYIYGGAERKKRVQKEIPLLHYKKIAKYTSAEM